MLVVTKKTKYKNLLYCKHNFCKLLLYGRAKESKIFTEATTNEALVMVASGSGFTAHIIISKGGLGRAGSGGGLGHGGLGRAGSEVEHQS